MKRSFRKSPRRSVTRRTSSPSLFSRSGCRSGFCANRATMPRRSFSAWRDSSKRPTWAFTPEETRGYVRKLWDRWWPHRDEMQRLVLPAKLWRLSGTRPLNHPQRRLAALAALAKAWPSLHPIARRKEREDAPRNSSWVSAIRFGIFITRSRRIRLRQKWRSSANRGSPRSWRMCSCRFFLAEGARRLDRLRKTARAPFESPARNRRHPALRRRSAPPALHENHRASTRACFRSTKTSVCRTTPIARNARSPSKCTNGSESLW